MTLTDKIARLKGDEPLLVEYLVDRLLLGQPLYGVWSANQERRNLHSELGAELIDGVAYLCMEAVRASKRPPSASEVALFEANKREPVEPAISSSHELIGDEFHEVLR